MQNSEGTQKCPLRPPAPCSRSWFFSAAVRNPCAVQNGGCMHDCRLDGARLYCDCRVGFVLAEDRKTCRGKRTHVSCSGALVASFHMKMHQTTLNMRSGLLFLLLLLLRVCVPDIDECQTEASNCAHGCHNTLGSYVCVCNAAYELGSDGKQCYSAFHVRKSPLSCVPPPPPPSSFTVSR